MLDNYYLDEFGVIHQKDWKPKVYDEEYLSYYEGLKERTIKLGYLRMGWVLGAIGSLPDRLLEIGYGMGTFLEAAVLSGISECFGADVTDYPTPDGARSISLDAAIKQRWDLVGLFDVLEHIPDISFLSDLDTNYLAIAVPFCRWSELGDDWFRAWRMRLPDEHLHHFDIQSLTKTLQQYGFEAIDVNHYEDGLRLRDGETGPNIISGLFVKRTDN